MERPISQRRQRLIDRYQWVEEPMHAAFGPWARDQANRRAESSLIPVEYRPNIYPGQRIETAKVPAEDPHPKAPDFIYYPIFYSLVAKHFGPLNTARYVRE